MRRPCSGGLIPETGHGSQAHVFRVDTAVIVHYRPRGSGLVNIFFCSVNQGEGDCTPPDTSGRFSMNAKMKVLALALLGLAGYAGSAVAGCPSSPVPPWSAAPALFGTVAIVAGG